MFFLPLRFNNILMEGPLEVFYIFKINSKSLYGPIKKLN